MSTKYKHEKFMREILYTSPSEMADKKTPNINNDKIKGAIFGYMHGLHSHLRYSILKLNDDTILKEDTNNYLKIAKDLGFEIALEFPYYGYNGDDITHEYLYVLWHNDYGILLKFYTLQMLTDVGVTKSIVQAGTLYYNYCPNNNQYIPDVMGDGYFKDRTWIGNNDCREALRLKMKLLKENGKFVVPWIKKPEVNLCHFGENNKVSDKATKERLNLIKNSSLRKNIFACGSY